MIGPVHANRSIGRLGLLMIALIASAFSYSCCLSQAPDIHQGLVLSSEPSSGDPDRRIWILDAGSMEEGKYCNSCKAHCSFLVSPAAPNGEATIDGPTATTPSQCIDWAEAKCPTNLIKATCGF